MIYEVKVNELGITDTKNTEDRFRTWFWNKSINMRNLDIEKHENNDEDENKEEKNQEEEKFKTQEIISLNVLKLEIK